MINKDFFAALDELERTKGISKDSFLDALKLALINAYKRNTGTPKSVDVKLVPERNLIKVTAYQTVVEEVEDKESQISLEDARLIDRKYRIGDIVSEEVHSKEFGRIAAQTAKQIIMQKLREVEGNIAISALNEKQDELLTVVVKRIDGKSVYVETNKIEACMTPQDLMPSDNFRVGDRIKVHVKKIKATSRGPQIMLSRTTPGFVKKLFELEVPEIEQGIVEIKSIAREPGYRTKIAVFSKDSNIDAVGAFVGNRGMRVNSIVSELGGEKIDIIPWDDDLLEFIARALSPAKVAYLQANDNERTAKVGVPDKELSLAIGKAGLNVRLAVKLTGWKIDVKAMSEMDQEEQKEEVEDVQLKKEDFMSYDFETLADSDELDIEY